MNLAILGATGRTGRPLVDQALDAGHRVTALVRNPTKLTRQSPNLTIMQGSLDAEHIRRVMTGQDVVLSALGHSDLKESWILYDVVAHVLAAMPSTGVKRFIYEGAYGTRETAKELPVAFKLVKATLLRHPYADHERAETLLFESSLDWVIARPTGLTDGPRTGVYEAAEHLPSAGRISRADVADFMLKQLTDNTWLRRAPGLRYKKKK